MYLRLGEPAGSTTVSDATGHGNSGVLGVGHALGVAGAISGDVNTALHFDGQRSGVDLGAKFDFVGRSSFSLELWAKVESVDDEYRHFFKKSAGQGASREAYGVFVHDGQLVSERLVGGQQVVVRVPSSSIEARWAHVVSTWDGERLRLFVDGVQAASTRDERPANPIAASLVVGCNDAFDNFVLRGDVDEVAVYDKALSGERIKAHFESGRGGR